MLSYRKSRKMEVQGNNEDEICIGRYLNFYNYERPHQSLGYRTPADVYYGRNN
ncbi:MAG: transposase [Nitrospirae bacterium]|nr:transposase [Nitrospirota bacterium]